MERRGIYRFHNLYVFFHEDLFGRSFVGVGVAVNGSGRGTSPSLLFEKAKSDPCHLPTKKGLDISPDSEVGWCPDCGNYYEDV